MISSYVTLTNEPWKEILQFAITLFAILNPVAGATSYLALVDKHEPHEKLHVAKKASIAIFIILLSIIWAGDTILNVFGISLSAFRIGGGLIVILVGLNMLEFIHLDAKPVIPTRKKDVAIVPLAIPIIAGPGVIAVTMTEIQNTFNNLLEKIIITLTTVIIVLIMWLILRFAPYFSRKLGQVGMDIMAKTMGIILVVIATQMILEGCIAVFPAWTAVAAVP